MRGFVYGSMVLVACGGGSHDVPGDAAAAGDAAAVGDAPIDARPPNTVFGKRIS